MGSVAETGLAEVPLTAAFAALGSLFCFFLPWFKFSSRTRDAASPFRLLTMAGVDSPPIFLWLAPIGMAILLVMVLAVRVPRDLDRASQCMMYISGVSLAVMIYAVIGLDVSLAYGAYLSMGGAGFVGFLGYRHFASSKPGATPIGILPNSGPASGR